MAGIGLLLNTAKDALLTQQYAMDVVSHNIANVSTDGYSRQTPTIEAKTPGPYGGLIFGRGVELQDIQRQLDTFVETRLRERESDLSAMSEKETYLSVLEGVFDENSGNSISAQFDAFWNAWQDLSNNPSGSAERTIVYESGAHLAQSFQDIRNDLDRFDQELDLSLQAGTDKINRLTSQIATLNEQIISMEINANANDLRDQRDLLIRNLSEHLDIKVFEDSRGHLTVTTTQGYTLVSKTDHYELSFESGEVRWEGSSGTVDITETITKGKMGGWLEVRDALLPKYRSELDELAASVIWNVNQVHSQGVGLEGMTAVTGTYEAADTGVAIGDSGLTFADDVEAGEFTMWVYEPDGSLRASVDVTINDPSVDTLNDVAAGLDGVGGVAASFDADGRLEISVGGGATFVLSEDPDDPSGVLAALGINTFFDGKNARDISTNESLNAHKEYLTAGRVDPATGEIAVGDNTNALAVADLREQKVAMDRFTYESPDTPASSPGDTFQGYYAYLIGSVGIKSESVQREQEYAEVVVNQLTQKRNDLSAVSLDEEMTNLIKYQHAYSAAAKLVSTADQMLQTLLETR
jgi:flagellar hook-associated protein 1 FlgK